MESHSDTLAAVQYPAELPRDYSGDWPAGDYRIAGRNRDSGCLEQSNFDTALTMLCEAAGIDPAAALSDTAPLYVRRVGHWACGWSESLVVRATAPAAVLDCAESILSALADYPILDESDYSRRQLESAGELWTWYSVKDRLHAIAGAEQWNGTEGISIFAARREAMPQHSGLAQYMCEA